MIGLSGTFFSSFLDLILSSIYYVLQSSSPSSFSVYENSIGIDLVGSSVNWSLSRTVFSDLYLIGSYKFYWRNPLTFTSGHGTFLDLLLEFVKIAASFRLFGIIPYLPGTRLIPSWSNVGQSRLSLLRIETWDYKVLTYFEFYLRIRFSDSVFTFKDSYCE